MTGGPGGTAAIGRDVLCVVTPDRHRYSETFIEAHVTGLPAAVKRLYGGYLPTRTYDGRPLMTMLERGLTRVLERGFGRSARMIRSRALRRYLEREQVAAVLAEYGQTGVSVLGACEAARVPLIVHFHGSDAYKARWLQRYGAGYPRLCRTAAAVIATSREMEADLLGIGARRDRLFYNPCGADTMLFQGGNPERAPPTFVAVGRFVEKKAPHLTLQAFSRVVARCPDARLVMIGDGELWETCRGLAQSLGIAHAVELPGSLPQAEVAARMRSARAFVQHSVRTSAGDREGTPIAILEAGATGLAVVSTRHGGIKDVVLHGRTGFLVEEGDVESMAQHLTALATDAGLAAALGEAARRHVRAHFSARMSLDTLWGIIQAAISRYRRR